MSKHNALDMFGRSGNPTLSDATFSDFENVDQKNHDTSRDCQQGRDSLGSRCA